MTSTSSTSTLLAGSRLLRRTSKRPSPAGAILLIGTPLVLLLFLLTTLDVSGLASLWENGHWTLTAAMAFTVAAVGARSAAGAERQVRMVAAAGVGVYLGGQILWDAQVALGLYPIPAPSDFLYLGMTIPFLGALAIAVRAGGSHGQLRTFVLDTAVLIATVVGVVHGLQFGVENRDQHPTSSP